MDSAQMGISGGQPPIGLRTTSDNGSLATGTPTTNPADSFGLFELTFTRGTLDFDVSQVDQAGFPFQLTTPGFSLPGTAFGGVGFLQDRTTLFNNFSTYLNGLE